jgi:hypothetical protein
LSSFTEIQLTKIIYIYRVQCVVLICVYMVSDYTIKTMNLSILLCSYSFVFLWWKHFRYTLLKIFKYDIITDYSSCKLKFTSHELKLCIFSPTSFNHSSFQMLATNTTVLTTLCFWVQNFSIPLKSEIMQCFLSCLILFRIMFSSFIHIVTNVMIFFLKKFIYQWTLRLAPWLGYY